MIQGTANAGIAELKRKKLETANLSPARQLAVNDVQQVHVSATQLLTGHKLWATLDYASIENPDVRGNLEWTVERAGTGHGIVLWFDADLVDGVGFSNAPGAPETVYGSLFFPGANLCHSSGIKSCAWALRQN